MKTTLSIIVVALLPTMACAAFARQASNTPQRFIASSSEDSGPVHCSFFTRESGDIFPAYLLRVSQSYCEGLNCGSSNWDLKSFEYKKEGSRRKIQEIRENFGLIKTENSLIENGHKWTFYTQKNQLNSQDKEVVLELYLNYRYNNPSYKLTVNDKLFKGTGLSAICKFDPYYIQPSNLKLISSKSQYLTVVESYLKIINGDVLASFQSWQQLNDVPYDNEAFAKLKEILIYRINSENSIHYTTISTLIEIGRSIDNISTLANIFIAKGFASKLYSQLEVFEQQDPNAFKKYQLSKIKKRICPYVAALENTLLAASRCQ